MSNLIRRTLVLALVFVAGVAVTAPVFAEEGGTPTTAAAAASGQVNVNSATADELAMLPHVGQATAQRIVAHREKNGPFKSVEDLLLVAGIGDKTFADLKAYVVLSGKTTLSGKVKISRTKG